MQLRFPQQQIGTIATSTFPFIDHDGMPFAAAWSELRLNPGTHNPFIPALRGITGLDEVLSMRAYRLAGVPTPPATWVHLGVIAGAEEVRSLRLRAFAATAGSGAGPSGPTPASAGTPSACRA